VWHKTLCQDIHLHKFCATPLHSIRNYRKTVIAALPELKYLDERPVFEDERRLVNAW
jgi:hypothetical protein